MSDFKQVRALSVQPETICRHTDDCARREAPTPDHTTLVRLADDIGHARPSSGLPVGKTSLTISLACFATLG